LIQIESKKEELFDLMAQFNGRFRIPGCRGETNGLLLEQLSVAVNPRPYDPQWYIMSNITLLYIVYFPLMLSFSSFYFFMLFACIMWNVGAGCEEFKGSVVS
jgi:hypothetical protein